jgi:AcrR family transcriptional regulator
LLARRPKEQITKQPKQERNAAATQMRILDAAQAEFAGKGFDGARLGTIARAASVQPALIHHYFEHKEGLYRAVIERALAAVASEGLSLLARPEYAAPAAASSSAAGSPSAGVAPGAVAGSNTPYPFPKGQAAPSVGKSAASKARAKSAIDLRALAVALVDTLLRFYAEHAPILSIVRSEAGAGGGAGNDIVKTYIKPMFDGVVTRLTELQRAGAIRVDVDPRQLCLSALAMAAFPYTEPEFVESLGAVDKRALASHAFREMRLNEIVETLLSRAVPPSSFSGKEIPYATQARRAKARLPR